MSTISTSSSGLSASKMITSSRRLMNSGLNAERTAAITCSSVPPDAEVGRQDQDRVAEVDRAALAVGQPALVEHLQQHVEHVRVGLLDLVEQDHRVRTPSHRLGQLTALVVADVAGRRTDKAGHRVLLAVLAHVDADHRAFVVEEELRQRLCQLGLADAGRAEEHERARRTVRVGDTGPAAAHRIRDRLHGLLSVRRRACRARLPCAAAWRSHPRASGRPECRSTPTPRRRCRRARPLP